MVGCRHISGNMQAGIIKCESRPVGTIIIKYNLVREYPSTVGNLYEFYSTQPMGEYTGKMYATSLYELVSKIRSWLEWKIYQDLDKLV